MSNSFANPQHVAQQTPLPMGFQKYWSRLPFPSPDLFHPEIESPSPASPALAGGFFTAEPLGKSLKSSYCCSGAKLCLTLQPHGLQLTRLPCPSPSPGGCSNSCPSSWWCHPTILSSAVPFSSCLQSFLASGSFQMSQFFTPGGQSIGASASTSVLPMNIQGWFP